MWRDVTSLLLLSLSVTPHLQAVVVDVEIGLSPHLLVVQHGRHDGLNGRQDGLHKVLLVHLRYGTGGTTVAVACRNNLTSITIQTTVNVHAFCGGMVAQIDVRSPT